MEIRSAEAEVRAAEDLKDLIRGVKAEPKVRAVPVPQPKVEAMALDLATALARWRKAKEDLETTERYLLMLLRESGL